MTHWGAINPANAESVFVDEAVTSHKTTLIRAGMRSQPEVPEYDPIEIKSATGIVMPRLPQGWQLLDVQVYPADSGPSVQIAALTEQHESISIVAMRFNSTSEQKAFHTSRGGDQIVYWEKNGYVFALVGSIPAQRLLFLASEVMQKERTPLPKS